MGMRIAIGVVCLLLLAHLVVLPLVKRRPVLLRGREAWALTVLLSLWLGSLATWWLAGALAVVVGALLWWLRPWLVIGLDARRIAESAVAAGRLVRFRVEPVDARTIRTGKTGTIHVRWLLGHWLRFAAKRTKRLALFQNVLRKSLENHHIIGD